MTDHVRARERALSLLDLLRRPPGYALPGGASEVEFQAFEDATGLRVPEELREWLRITDTSVLGPGGLYGVAASRGSTGIRSLLAWIPVWTELGWIPVAGDGCGSNYVLDTRRSERGYHPVYFADHEDSYNTASYIVASNLWSFLAFLFDDDIAPPRGLGVGWPFEKAAVLRDDPDILLYSGVVPLPWET